MLWPAPAPLLAEERAAGSGLDDEGGGMIYLVLVASAARPTLRWRRNLPIYYLLSEVRARKWDRIGSMTACASGENVSLSCHFRATGTAQDVCVASSLLGIQFAKRSANERVY